MRNHRSLWKCALALSLALAAWGCRAVEEEAVITITPDGEFNLSVVTRLTYGDEYLKEEDIRRRDALARDYGNGADGWTLLLRDAGAENVSVKADYSDAESGRKRLTAIRRTALVRTVDQLNKLFATDTLAFKLMDDAEHGTRTFETLAFARPVWTREEGDVIQGLKDKLPATSAKFFASVADLYAYWNAHTERRERFRFFFNSDGDPGQFPPYVFSEQEAEGESSTVRMPPTAQETAAGARVPREKAAPSPLNEEEKRLLAAYVPAAREFFDVFETLDGTMERALEKCCPTSMAVRVVTPIPVVEMVGFSEKADPDNELRASPYASLHRDFKLCPPTPMEAVFLFAARSFSPSLLRLRSAAAGAGLAKAEFRAELPSESEIRKTIEGAFEFTPVYRLTWSLAEQDEIYKDYKEEKEKADAKAVTE